MHMERLNAPFAVLKVPAGHTIPLAFAPAAPVPSGQYLPGAQCKVFKFNDAAAASGQAYPAGQG